MKNTVKFFLPLLLIFFLIISLPIRSLVKELNCFRDKKNVERINSKLIVMRGVNSLIYSCQDTLDPFMFKIVEVSRNFLQIPCINAEADFYKHNHFELVSCYKWEISLFNIKIKNVSNSFTYILDSIETPEGKMEIIKTSRFISKNEADSIIISWRNHCTPNQK